MLKEPKLKDQIIKSFRFKIPVAYVKLYDNKTERRTKLIEALEDFFFVGKVYFYSEPEESKLFGVILVSRFRNLLNLATYCAKKYNGQFDRVPDLSRFLFGTPFKEIAVPPSRKRIRGLKKVLSNYHMLSRDFEVKEIMGAFKSKKPVTSVELYNIRASVIEKFIEELSEFFFVGQVYFDPESPRTKFSGDVFVSRSKELLDLMVYHAKKRSGMLDGFADLSGILFGTPLKEVARYCSQESLTKYNFIK